MNGSNIKLLKPSTYMNNSGESIVQAMRFFKLDPSQVFVFYDDLDLSPGKCRIRLGGGTGGHNGLRSIEKHIGPDYWRVRIGIGHPGRKELVLAHVLNDFSEQEKNGWVEKIHFGESSGSVCACPDLQTVCLCCWQTFDLCRPCFRGPDRRRRAAAQ